MVEISDTFGLWERSLIAWPDGRRDTTTYAGWLQGPALFADLRQPVGAPSFDEVACLNDLGPAHFGWLARRGCCRPLRPGRVCVRMASDGRFPEHQRRQRRAGFLVFDDEVLVETGRDVPYIEHWHRTTRCRPVRGSLAGARRPSGLLSPRRCHLHVRPRPRRAAAVQGLAGRCRQQQPSDKARALLDCEISQGRIESDAWIIERSSLPYRTGQDLAVLFSADRTSVAVADQASDGIRAFTRALGDRRPRCRRAGKDETGIGKRRGGITHCSFSNRESLMITSAVRRCESAHSR